jgi:hypothetical protein
VADHFAKQPTIGHNSAWKLSPCARRQEKIEVRGWHLGEKKKSPRFIDKMERIILLCMDLNPINVAIILKSFQMTPNNLFLITVKFTLNETKNA